MRTRSTARYALRHQEPATVTLRAVDATTVMPTTTPVASNEVVDVLHTALAELTHESGLRVTRARRSIVLALAQMEGQR